MTTVIVPDENGRRNSTQKTACGFRGREEYFRNTPSSMFFKLPSRTQLKRLTIENYAELSRAIVYWCKTHNQKYRGGFWNGETANNSAKGRVYGIILAGRY
jgi:hypothetical protein